MLKCIRSYLNFLSVAYTLTYNYDFEKNRDNYENFWAH